MASPTRAAVVVPTPYQSSTPSHHTFRARNSLSVATRSMARGRALVKPALGEIHRNGSATDMTNRTMGGGKRKQASMDQDGVERRRKVVRYSDENNAGEAESPAPTLSAPVTPPRSTSNNAPITPVRAVEPVSAPTPAREILRAGYQKDVSEDGQDRQRREGDEGEGNCKFVMKPPTPPRLKLRPRMLDDTVTIVSEDVPMTPGKRPRSPDHMPLTSSKKPSVSRQFADHISTSASSATEPNNDIVPAGVQYLNPASVDVLPTGSLALSPRRALGSISRFGTTPKKGAGSLPPPPSSFSMKRMTPTVPIPFTFSTPRTKSAIPPTAPTTESLADGTSDSTSTRTSLDSNEGNPVRVIKPLPRTAVMGPPSRLPIKAVKAPASTAASISAPLTSTAASSSKPKPRPQLGVAERRPVRRVPSTSTSAKPLAVLDESGDSKPADVPVRRKPSYPSSLGSGPLAKPRSRLVSGPIQPPRSFSTSTSIPPLQDDMDTDHKLHATPRSVSDPVGRPRASLTLSTRREGFTSDTSKSLAGLSDALAKLKMKKDESGPKAGSSMSSRPKAASVLADVSVMGGNANTNVAQPLSSSRLSSVHRPRSSIAGADVSMMEDGDRSLAVLMNTNAGTGKALRGVVAFVDVKTEDGGCAGDIWSDMLRGLGAKVNVRLTTAVTHIIYKSGLPTTLNWYRRQEQEERPYLVGVGWLLKSKKAGERLDEAEFTVDIAVEDVFQKRRKSMEPKALAAANQGIPLGLSGVSGLSLATRKSLQYAPKIGSPLKKGYTRDAFDD